MRLAVNLVASFVVLAVCTWLVWPGAEQRADMVDAVRAMDWQVFWPYFAGHLVLHAITHFLRAWRWNNLLAPIGVHLPPGKLLAYSSIGFMAIMALPARLGEFVRPALLRQKGRVSAAAVLGTVAVERIIDGLVVSLIVFVCFWNLRGPNAPPWMMPVAVLSLAVFVAAVLFLAFALKWPEQTVRYAVAATGAPWVAPGFGVKLSARLELMISGFRVLRDGRNLASFIGWSAIYWICNGVGLWVLAKGLGLPLPLIGAFAVMGLVAVGITAPNTPGLVGQYHALTVAGLALYLPEALVKTQGLTYAIVLHGVQLVWYMVFGAACLVWTHVSWGTLVHSASADALDQPGSSSSS